MYVLPLFAPHRISEARHLEQNFLWLYYAVRLLTLTNSNPCKPTQQ